MSPTSLGRQRRLPLSVVLLVLALGSALLAGCGPKMSWQNMAAQPKFEPFDANPFFPDRSSARPAVANTVARGFINNTGGVLETGKGADGNEVNTFPFPVTIETLHRGQERFNIYCSPCHGYSGIGNGVVVQRGYPKPVSLHDQRLRDINVGHFVNVIASGWGQMPSYAFIVPPQDRWAIAAYIRALQYSQNANLEDVPQSERPKLEAGGTP